MADPLRILLVEDVEDDAELVLRELRRGGHAVEAERVATAADFRAALDRGTWDLIIADYSMPGFSGRAALDIVLERELDTPFVFVSGTIGEETAVEAMKAGAGDYVMKGNLRRLVPAIERELRDATVRRERQATEEALRRAEERFATVFRASPVAISVSTLDDGRYVDLNASVERLLGYTREEMIGRTADDLGVWAERDERRAVIGELRRGRAVTNRDVTLRTKGGDLLSTLCNFERIESAGEGCLVAFVLDVTERRQLEAELQQAQRLEAIGRLAGGVAHDFNNLLTVVLGCCDLLAGRSGSAAAVPQEVREIRTAAEAAATLTRQLLAFSRKQVLQPQRIDLSAVVARAGRMLGRLLGEHVELVTKLARRGESVVLADGNQLERVIFNLAINARDAMPRGGRLQLKTAVVDIDAAAARIADVSPGRFCRLTVADSGMGMDAETLAHVFEPFFSTKEPGRGTGLGLATVHGIVSQSDGFVRVESEPNRGTTFEVFLPWVEGTPAEEAATRAEEPSARGLETILLVEDERAVRELVQRLLEAQGYTVLTAPDGSSALRLAREHAGPIDLMITDLVMPGMSGRTLAERLSEIRPEVKVLFTSGYAGPDALRQGLVTAEAAFLGKPFTSAALAEKVRTTLAGGAGGGNQPEGEV